MRGAISTKGCSEVRVLVEKKLTASVLKGKKGGLLQKIGWSRLCFRGFWRSKSDALVGGGEEVLLVEGSGATGFLVFAMAVFMAFSSSVLSSMYIYIYANMFK